jgi:hypothetical protein
MFLGDYEYDSEDPTSNDIRTVDPGPIEKLLKTKGRKKKQKNYNLAPNVFGKSIRTRSKIDSSISPEL